MACLEHFSTGNYPQTLRHDDILNAAARHGDAVAVRDGAFQDLVLGVIERQTGKQSKGERPNAKVESRKSSTANDRSWLEI
jgi:hypothetical protein